MSKVEKEGLECAQFRSLFSCVEHGKRPVRQMQDIYYLLDVLNMAGIGREILLLASDTTPPTPCAGDIYHFPIVKKGQRLTGLPSHSHVEERIVQ